MDQTTFAPLLSRKLIKPHEISSTNSQQTFSVLQWNTLASHLDTPDSFPKINPDYLPKAYRQPLMITEIKAFAPDFICMEEVHNSDVEFFKSIYTNYACIFHSKYQGEDGLCFLYNQDKFEIVQSELKTYLDTDTGKQQSQVFQLNLLKLKSEEGSPKNYVMIVFTHLKAKGPNTAIRVGQVKQLIQFIEEKQKQFIDSQTEASTKLGLVVCGDFNDEPESEPLKYFEEHTKLQTAFAGETYTTFKVREKVYKRVIDYIYYDDNLNLIEKSNIPGAEVIGELGLPNADYPSDHLSLFCRFEFK